MKQFHNLITNTTSLVGYIAVLMFVGAYIGGDRDSLFDPMLLKGSIGEFRGSALLDARKSVIITIDGRKYEARIEREVEQKLEFQY